jgi:hypothetical protein
MRAALEIQTVDRIREPGARIHRAGVIQMRPILEQLVVWREVAVVEDGTELFEKILIADGLETFEHRQMDEDELRAMGFRLARDFFSEKVIFAAVEPVSRRATRVRGTGSRGSARRVARGTGCSMSTSLPSPMKLVLQSVRFRA